MQLALPYATPYRSYRPTGLYEPLQKLTDGLSRTTRQISQRMLRRSIEAKTHGTTAPVIHGTDYRVPAPDRTFFADRERKLRRHAKLKVAPAPAPAPSGKSAAPKSGGNGGGTGSIARLAAKIMLVKNTSGAHVIAFRPSFGRTQPDPHYDFD